MQPKSDAQLLNEYAQSGVDVSFAEIVQRHTNLVYSAALRQVESPDVAADITQKVFISLATGASSLCRKLSPDASLAGWLCRSARNLSLNFRRDEFRRQTRERQAMEQAIAVSDAAPDWERLRLVLDEAMAELSEPDYDALVLRFFKNQDLRAIGSALSVSDDAAQKRVSRALEKLREQLSQRGVKTSAAALSIVISANAIQAAPVGLAVSISTVAAISGTSLTAVTATKAIAMTTLQKVAVTVAVAVLAGVGVYEARQSSRLQTEMQTLQQQQGPLAERIKSLEAERDTALARAGVLSDQLSTVKTNPAELLKLRRALTELKSENAKLTNVERAPAEQAAKSWADRVAQLKERLQQTPSARIPEMAVLTEDNWLNAARNPLVTDKDYRRAFASLRSAAENQFIISMQNALKKYSKENGGQFPTDTMALKQFFATAPEEGALERYAVLPASSVPNMVMGGDWLITVKDPIDEEFDSLWVLGPHGFGNSNYQGTKDAKLLQQITKAYAAANNGREPSSPTDVLPYLTTPEQRAAYQRWEKQHSSESK